MTHKVPPSSPFFDAVTAAVEPSNVTERLESLSRTLRYLESARREMKRQSDQCIRQLWDEGMTGEQIAKVMGVSKKTVSARLRVDDQPRPMGARRKSEREGA